MAEELVLGAHFRPDTVEAMPITDVVRWYEAAVRRAEKLKAKTT